MIDMVKKHPFICMIITLVMICCILADVYLVNGLKIALKLNGFELPQIIYCGIDDNGDEYRVVRDDAPDNRRLGYFIKGNWGIWKAAQLVLPDSPEKEVLPLGWMKISEFGNYGDEAPVFEFEVHQVYYGWNAVKELDGFAVILTTKRNCEHITA